MRKRDKQLTTADPITQMMDIQMLATFSAYTWKRTGTRLQCKQLDLKLIVSCLKVMGISFILGHHEKMFMAMVVGPSERRYKTESPTDIRALLLAIMLMLREEKLEVTVP